MFKIQSVKRRLLARSYGKEASIVLSLSFIIFFIISLGTYNPYDTSWAYATTETITITNACGVVGAHIAAFFCYMWGAAALLFIVMLLTMLSFFIKDILLMQELDRWIAYGVMIVSSAALCTAHGISIWGEPVPGGLFGSIALRILTQWLDKFGALLFLYTVMLVAFIIITQFSFIHIFYGIHKSLQLVGRAFVWLKPIYHALGKRVTMMKHHAERLMRNSIYGIKSMARVIGGYFNVVSIPIEYEAPGEDYDEELPELTAMSDAYLLTTEQSFSAPVVRDEVEKHDIASPRMHEEEQFQLPNKSIFIGVKDEFNHAKQMKELKALAQVLEEKLCCFGVSGSVLSIKFGPVVTLFEYQPDIDSKISKIIALEDDLALALQALSIRIIAPIPGRSVVGFEVSNPHRKSVLLADVVQSASYEKFVGGIPLILGQDTVGNNVVVDLAKMPHLLVAGSTGSGKSVALNAMLISILCARTPDEVRLILIDPKRLEFVPYADIAHLLFPIITESKDAVSALGWVVHEMDVRYKRMAEKGARNCADYNKIVTRAEQIPFIVVIIDELSDLMMTAGREIEGLIIRITQMARAAGIHMIVATQRPSVDVITGLIKVNFPSRISFRVTSKIDSRTILDCGGADKLLGRGDMLFLDSTDSTLKRVHGAYVTDDEIKKVADAIRQQQSPLYLDLEPHIANVGGDIGQEDEALYSEILKFLKEIDEISISLLQRKFRIGYNRSARIIEILEARGLVASSESGKTRKVIR